MGNTTAAARIQPQIRKPKFPLEKIEKERGFGKKIPFFTAFLSSLSVLFPEGERFFIRSVKAFQNDIEDQNLRNEIKAFAGQEAVHGNVHDKLNERFVEIGLDFRSHEKMFCWLFFDILEKNILKLFPVWGKRLALSITAAAEHFTATLGRFLLSLPAEKVAWIDPITWKIIEWHSLEELEHKAVAFDVYQKSGGGYFTRILGMTIAVQLLGLLAVVGTIRALFYFGIPNPKQIVRDIRFFFGSPGFTWAVIFYILEYYYWGFHPNNEDDQALIEKFSKLVSASI
ncbi:metal-dependent hydrolase [Leptospira semungkisensis]|uniref:Metal-dependent hydrolase n=1 Tax=Leptospira semungkisensis TaxID=2484985 RepID=A0A4R9FQV1_9LEPT|nr:metal-dependent hydrolase [Leptospira semungkisensis]TGK01088.1 metal-dependent hydrolase [Leptospira semungkisensis]